jgi:hypothetical protein
VAKTGLALRGVRSNYHHQFGTLELFDGTRVSAVTHGSEQAIVAGDWQYREQLSTLFVPMTARASFPTYSPLLIGFQICAVATWKRRTSRARIRRFNRKKYDRTIDAMQCAKKWDRTFFETPSPSSAHRQCKLTLNNLQNTSHDNSDEIGRF